jgi:predicted Zn finger-like uncharacterized protein
MRTPCPKCATQFNVPENLIGKRVRCPKCSEAFLIPAFDNSAEDVICVDAADEPDPPDPTPPNSTPSIPPAFPAMPPQGQTATPVYASIVPPFPNAESVLGGFPQAQSPMTPSSSTRETWTWEHQFSSANKAYFCAAHLDELNLTLWSFISWDAKQDLVLALEAGETRRVFGAGRGKIIPLSGIFEFRCSDKAKVAEVYYGDNSCAVIQGKSALAHRQIFSALQRVLAPGRAPRPGFLSSRHLYAVTILWILIWIAVAVVYFLTGSSHHKASPNVQGQNVQTKDDTTKLIAVAVLTLFVAVTLWLVISWFRPSPADVIDLRLPPDPAQVRAAQRPPPWTPPS